MKKNILIPGRKEFTKNYEAAVSSFGASPVVSISESSIAAYDLLLLPGGGDIDPAFFNQKNSGSTNIDYELDKAQFRLLDLFVSAKKPIMGISKGMQMINIYFGGNIIQNMNSDKLLTHSYQNEVSYHPVFLNTNALLLAKLPPSLFQRKMQVNSAHHQCIGHLGKDLTILQYCPDFVPEAIAHMYLPILGIQWHPERLLYTEGNALHPFLKWFLFTGDQ